jgi:hypothetical protein
MATGKAERIRLLRPIGLWSIVDWLALLGAWLSVTLALLSSWPKSVIGRIRVRLGYLSFRIQRK